MLTRKTFVHAIDNIKKHEEVMDRLNAPLNEISEFPVDLDFSKFHREALLDVLHEAMNDTEYLIGWWLYENVEKIITWTENGQEVKYDVTDVNDLYDYLVADVKRTPFELLPIEDCDSENETQECRHKRIRKRDFLTYFDRVVDFVGSTDVILHIVEDEGETPATEALLIAEKRYEAMKAAQNETTDGSDVGSDGP